MSFVYEIIKDAYRESNLIPISQSPTADEQNEALRLLNRFVKSVYGNEAGDALQPVVVGKNNITTTNSVTVSDFTDNDFVAPNSRILANLEEDTTIYLDPNPEDGARLAVLDVSGNFATNSLTLNANGRKIEGSTSVTLSTNSTSREWFYKAEEGTWVVVTDLTLNDTFPFPSEFEDFFIISLATRLNPRNGAVVDDQTMMNYKRQRNAFRARYSQKFVISPEDAIIRLTGTRLNRLTSDSFDGR